MFDFVGVVIGILLVLLGVFMVFFFPTKTEYQPESMGITGIIMGIIFLIVGFVLVFL